MSQLIQVHHQDPQKRLLQKVIDALHRGELIIYPTDSSYALGCLIGNKEAMERIRAIRKLDNKHNFTLVCRDLSEIATYAKVSNSAYRLLKSLTPGPYTFLLKATHETPRRLQNPKRKTIGIRVPDHRITLAMLAALDQPIMSSTLLLPDDPYPLNDIEEITARLQHHVDLIIDGGSCGLEPTTVMDLGDSTPKIVRAGMGSIEVIPH